MYIEKGNRLCSSLQTRQCKQDVFVVSEICTYKNHHAMPKSPERATQSDWVRLSAAFLLLLYLPTEVTVVPLDGEICSNLGSIKGVKEEEDLCFWSVLLADWVCNVNFNFINTNDIKKMNIKTFQPTSILSYFPITVLMLLHKPQTLSGTCAQAQHTSTRPTERATPLLRSRAHPGQECCTLLIKSTLCSFCF